MNNFSYHIVYDNVDPVLLQRTKEHLINLQPRYVNVVGAARFEQAINYSVDLARSLPQTRVIFRHWPDDGLLKRFNFDSWQIYNSIIAPNAYWLKPNNIIWMLDNESTADDLRPYARCSLELMDICGKNGIALAVGRFATGNPREDQYDQLDDMWLGLKRWGKLHIWSPNEYFDKATSTSGVGSIQRFMLGWDRCKQRFDFTPETVIGEFGLAVNYNPQIGWKASGLHESHYARLCLEYFHHWYNPLNICVNLFSVGQWHGFEVGEAFFNIIENEAQSAPEIPEMPTPIEDIKMACLENYVRVRTQPVNGQVVGHLHKNDYVIVLENGDNIGINNQWIKIQFEGKIGYTAGWFYVRLNNRS